MNKQKKLRRLTWGCFLKRKIKEILKFIGIIFLLTIFPYWIGKIIYIVHPKSFMYVCLSIAEETCKFIPKDFWVIGFILGAALGLTFLVLYLWLESNWIKSKREAEGKIEK